jgi:hypothetical protein
VTLEELREHALETRMRWESLEDSAEETVEDIWRARIEGDEGRVRFWEERRRKLQEAADRARERADEAEQALEDAEYAAEYPEQAAAEAAEEAERERAAAARWTPAAFRALWDDMLGRGVIDEEFHRKLTREH